MKEGPRLRRNRPGNRRRLLNRKCLPNQDIQLICQLLPAFTEKYQVVLQGFRLIHMTGNLTTGAIRHRTQSIDSAFGLPGAVVKPNDQFFECRSVPTQHAERFFQP